MNNWRKTHNPCHVCDKKAIGCYRPDMDMTGLCFCKKHKEQVKIAYVALMQGNKEMAEELLVQRPNKLFKVEVEVLNGACGGSSCYKDTEKTVEQPIFIQNGYEN